MDDENTEEKRYKLLGFKPQKEIIYNKFLPYADKLDEESLQLYKDIKTNLIKSVILREMRPGIVLWVSRLNKYIKVYGLKFSKEDHVALIKLMYELLTIPDLEPTRVNKFATTLTLLLKKKELISPNDLQLPWRPLYDLYTRITATSQTTLGMYRYFSSLDTNLEVLVHAARCYFPASATQEMLDEWRPKLCPYDHATVSSAIENFEFFLPVIVQPQEADISYRLWFDEFMTFWEVCHNAPPWEMDMLWLMARLAMYNIGYIDWEPHLPIMFTRFLRSLDLPVSYKQKQSQKHHKLETTPMAVWIVSVIGNGGSALNYLEKFIQTIESYYHPANSGRWSVKLRELFRKIPFYFVQRLHRERFKKPSWEPKVRPTHLLTEDDIDRFVEIMIPVVTHVIYSRQATSDISSGLQHLATLRPNKIIPLVLDRVYNTLDTLTEPHKLTAAIQCLVAVARPMLTGPQNNYPEGPTHAIPLLMSLLPGIDPNDIRKCLVTFQFISTFVSMIPLVDSSNIQEGWELTETEQNICENTAQFEDFVLQFLDRVFTLVQSSSLEVTRLEQVDLDKRSKLEAVAESALSSICNVIITQTSQKIFQLALRKLYIFVSEHILETKVSGQLVAIMVKSFIRIQPESTLKLFVPYLTDRVHTLLGDSQEIQNEEILDNELLYNLLILSEMLDCNGTALLPYLDQITSILDKTLHLTCIQGYVMGTRLLNHILISLTFVQPLEYRSAPPPFYEINDNDNDKKLAKLPIREWGSPGDINNLGIKWYIPSVTEIKTAETILYKYLLPEMSKLNDYVDDKVEISREKMRQTLAIILGCLGVQSVLPIWEEEPYLNVQSRLESWAFEMIIGTNLIIRMPDGGNVRKTLASLMERLQVKLLKNVEDDTKSFFNLIGIWDALIMTKYRGRDFESHWKNFHLVKKVLADCLRGGKRHLRPLLIDRIMLHQEFRTESRSFTFTETHRKILLNMYSLATSHYSEVRVRAQKKLFVAVSSFPYAYTTLTPLIKKSLQLDSKVHHEEFKGCLYVLLGPKSVPIIARHDWEFVSEIWPFLVTSKPSEKPSVINLMNCIVETIHKNFPTISIKLVIPEGCVEKAQMLQGNNPVVQLNLTEREIEFGLRELERLSVVNEQRYLKILDMLYETLVSGTLHWRYHTMALSFIRDLVHPNVKYPKNIISYILNSLLNESLEIRKLAIRITVFILKQHKEQHKKIKVDPLKFATDCDKNCSQIENVQAKCNTEISDGTILLSTITDEKNCLIDQKMSDTKTSVPKENQIQTGALRCHFCPCPGIRDDNKWIQYNFKTRPLNSTEWNKMRYLHKQYFGFYCWPKEIEMYAAGECSKFQENDTNSELPKLENVNLEVSNLKNNQNLKELENFFGNQKNIDSLINFLVLEEKKGHDKFNGYRFTMFKNLFRNFEDKYFDNFVPHLERLVLTKEEHNQRCAAEIISGVLRGSKHWPFEKIEKLWLVLTPIIKTALANMTVETIPDWGVCFATACENRDPNRHHFLYELLMDQPFGRDEASFIECGRMYVLQGAMNQQIWRVAELSKRLFDYLQNYLVHPFQNVRDRVSSVLVNIFETDLFSNVQSELSIKDFVKDVLPKLTILYNANNINDITSIKNLDINDSESQNETKENAIRLFKTICKWIIGSITRANFGSLPEFYEFFPLACLLQSYDSDQELTTICSMTLALLSQSLTLSKFVPNALSAIESVSKSGSWSAREASAQYLQVFIFHNMAIVSSNKDWVEKVKEIVLGLLQDEKPEVRVQASQVLGGLLHCQFLPESEKLLIYFKKKAKTKLSKTKVVQNSSTNATPSANNSLNLSKRHSGVLGMCAFINAHPYDVPDYLPSVFSELGAHLNDPQPIPTTIRKTMSDFKRTHHDNWDMHQLKFTEDELLVLNDLTVPPSYYA